MMPIRTKLMSAQKDDKPRWGDFPEKTDLGYIRRLIKSGTWFDDKAKFIAVKEKEQVFYAPKYMTERSQRFKYLLDPLDNS